MKNILCVAGFLIAFFITGNAQNLIDFNNYIPLKCQGTIPEDFKKELSRHVDDARKEQGTGGKQEKKQEIEFAELSNYQINNILFSGKVLYGDVLTRYVNKVADIILENEPELKKKLRFYVLKNSDLNAYSTQGGVIFVSVGLLAQIENEAQLAFILCHEVIHFRNNHNLDSYKKRQEMDEKKAGGIDVRNRLSSILNYSKEHELEADREGLELFLKTPYSTKELNNLFDVMLYSYLPFDEIAFDSTYFNAGKMYILPGKYFLKTVADITAEEDMSDSMSSHPNIRKRREAIRELLLSKNHASGKPFMNTQETFEVVQRAARSELAIICLQDARFEEAFYNGYLLEKTYGKNLFSDKMICASLYALAKQANHDEKRKGTYSRKGSDESKEYWELVEGESQAVYYFVHKITDKELSVLAARQLMASYKTYKDVFFQERLKSIINELADIYDLDKKDFYRESDESSDSLKAVVVVADSTVDEPKKGKLSKVSKIKKIRTEQVEKVPELKNKDYYRFAFSSFYDDSAWREAFVAAASWKDRKAELANSENYMAYKEALEKITNRHGEALDISKFVMLNPYYSSYIKKYFFYHSIRIKNPKVTPLEEIEIEKELARYFNDYAKKLDLDMDMIGVSQQATMETEQFNDYQQMVNWFGERVSLGKMGAYTYNEQYMDKFADQYGYIGLCYVINVNKSLEVVFVLFDLKTGGSKFIYEKELKRGKPLSVHTRMMVYDMLHQVKQKPHKINKLKKKYGIEE
jgi:hypothetical protein